MADRDVRGVRRSVVRPAGGRAARAEPRIGMPAGRIATEPPGTPAPTPEAVTIEPVTIEPVTIEPVTIEPVTNEPAGSLGVATSNTYGDRITDSAGDGPDTLDALDGDSGRSQPEDASRPDGGDPADRWTDGTNEQPGEGRDRLWLGGLVVRDLPDGFVTEAQLEDAEAEAGRLRELAAETRRLLDRPLPPLSPGRRRNRKKALLLGGLVAGGAAGVIAAGLLVPWSDLGGSNTRDAATDAGPATAASAPAQVAPAATGPAALLPPRGVLPRTGPGVTEPGSALSVRVLANGDLSVVEQAVLGPGGLPAIQLALPSAAGLGGQVSQLRPKVSGLRAAVNSQGVAVQVNGTGWTITPGARRARTVRLSYTLSGATIRSRPSASGRAIAVLVPLLADTLRRQGLPMTVHTYATAINAVTCPGAPSTQILCGMQDSDGWSATVPAGATSPALLMSVTL